MLGYKLEEYNKKFNNSIEWRCGGSLITSIHVLTAAHCAVERDGLPVLARLGSLSTVLPTEPNRQERGIVAYYLHEKYSSTAKRNDIAILKLDEPVNLSDPVYVFPICLDTRTGPFEDKNGIISGFGITESENLIDKSSLIK